MQTTGLGGGLETSGLGSCFCIRAFGARAFRSCFSWFVLLVVLFVVRAFGFVLLVVLFVVRALGFVLLFVLFVVRSFGARMCFLFDALKFLEACVARSEVS